MSLTDEQRTEITELLFLGHKINAIKVYRNATGAGLKESKDFVDALEASLLQTMPEKFEIINITGPSKSFIVTLLIVIMGVGAAISAYLFFEGFQ